MQVSLVNLQKQLWSGEADFVTAPGTEGELGIAPGHAPLLTGLAAGPVEVRTGDATEIFHISGGILEVSNGEVTLLADIALATSEIDAEEVERRMREAQEAFASQDYEAAVRSELAEATARLRTLQRTQMRKKRR